MSVQAVFRVQCDGPCKGWLRKGRTTPPHWSPDYAESFPTHEDAEQAAGAAGWTDGVCPRDQQRTDQ